MRGNGKTARPPRCRVMALHWRPKMARRRCRPSLLDVRSIECDATHFPLRIFVLSERNHAKLWTRGGLAASARHFLRDVFQWRTHRWRGTVGVRKKEKKRSRKILAPQKELAGAHFPLAAATLLDWISYSSSDQGNPRHSASKWHVLNWSQGWHDVIF